MLKQQLLESQFNWMDIALVELDTENTLGCEVSDFHTTN